MQNYKTTIANALKRFGKTDDDAAYAALLVCGFTRSAAYRYIYPTKASATSVNTMAGRKLREPQVQQYLRQIISDWNFDCITLATNFYLDPYSPKTRKHSKQQH